MGTTSDIVSQATTERFIRLPELERIVGFKRSTIYRKTGEGTFPAPIKCGPNTTVWLASSIDRWMAETIAAACPVVA
jgi:prophage regulatory protein